MLHDPKKEALIEEELFHANLNPMQQQLLEIAQIFKDRGWCQQVAENAAGNVCLFGAVEHTHARSFIGLKEFAEYVFGTVSGELSDVGDELIRYNDARGQTKNAIIRDLQYCALG